MAFRHLSWEQRARRVRRRKQRRYAAAAVTLTGGQLAWMFAQGAAPAGALEANRSMQLISRCAEQIGEICQAGDPSGGVEDVALSADGRWAAIVTDAALVDADGDGGGYDVYVIDAGASNTVRWITDVDHPDGDSFWNLTQNDQVDISADGQWVTWTMHDQGIPLFLPPAVDVEATPSFDTDSNTDVFVAEVDVDGTDGPSDGDLTTGAHGTYFLASVDDAGVNLDFNTSEPSISNDGRFIAFTHDTAGGSPPLPTEVMVHDRDVDEDGVFDEATFPTDQTTFAIQTGDPSADSPEIAGDGGFVAYRQYEEDNFDSGEVFVWRRSDESSFSVTATDFTGGSLAGTVASAPSISADGTKVAYDFEITDGDLTGFDWDPFRNQTIVVNIDPGLGTIVADDPSTPLNEGPYVASQVPTDAEPISDSSSESFPSLSDDGRYVTYESNADNVAGTIGSGQNQIYAVDLLQEADADRVPVLVSATGSGGFDTPANIGSDLPVISGDGRFIAFISEADNLGGSPSDTPNAYRLEWIVNEIEPSGPLLFPDTSVGASSAPSDLAFDTDDFGPWYGGSLEFLDGYLDPLEHDYSVIGGCASPTVPFHANDPCVVQVTFTPLQVGNRVAELCLSLSGQFFCTTTAIVGGQALVPDGIGPLVRESVEDDETQIVGGEGSRDPAISANGRYLAFATDVDIDDNDINGGAADIYVRDRLRGTTALISDGQGDGPSFDSLNPAISGDGRFITFQSAADKAPEPDAPEGDGGALDVFRIDRGAPDPATGDFVPGSQTVQIVSVGTDGGDFSLFDDAFDASISGDGSQIAFTVAGGEGSLDVFVRNLTPGAVPNTTMLGFSLPENVTHADEADISADGEHVAFVGRTVLGEHPEIPGFFITSELVYVYDRDVDGDGVLDEFNEAPPAPVQTRIVQVTTGEFTPQGAVDPPEGPADFREFAPFEGTDSFDPAISGDGTTVAYTFQQTYDQNNAEDPIDQRLTPIPAFDDQVVVADRDPASGLPTLSEVVSLAGPGDANKTLFENIAENAGRCLTGSEGCGASSNPDVSDDGRYVTFATQAENLVARPAVTLPDAQFCGFGDCDIIAVDRDATSNAGGPQHVNEPPLDIRVIPQFSDVVDREYGAPVISGDGRFIAFDTDAEYFLGYFNPSPTTGFFFPVDNNGEPDVFLREWQPVVDTSVPIAFPDTLLGATSAPQTARFSTQDFGPAPVLAVELLGGNPGDFLINSSLNCLPPLPGGPADPVPPVPVHGRVHLGDDCAVSVAFRPTAVGARNAVLRVTTGHPFSVPDAVAAANQVTEIPLTGSGAIQVVPGDGGFSSQPTFDFGSQIVTTTSPEIAIPVTNSGDSPFQITSVTKGGTNPGDFTIVGTDCIGPLAPGATCTVRVTFTPTAPGERSATLIFTDNAPGGPHQIGLTGRAPAPTLVVNPGVVAPGRTVQIQGLNWAPNQVVTITTADAFNPAVTLAGTTTITANAFGGIDGSLLFFPKTITGPRIVIATGSPNTLTAFQPLLITSATINGVDFVSRS